MPILTKKTKKCKQKEIKFKKDLQNADFKELTRSFIRYEMEASNIPKDETSLAKFRKPKTIRKLKSVFKKGKQKLFKSRKRVTKLCTDKLGSFDRTFIVLEEFTKSPCGNINQSALGSEVSCPKSPRLRSSSCTRISEISCDDVTIACPTNRRFPELENYSKYVPVRKIWGPLYPRSLVEDFKMVWLDMQVWYSKYYDLKSMHKTDDDLNATKSESSLVETPSKSKAADTNSTERIVFRTERDERQRLRHLRHRFHMRGNTEYLSMVSFQRKCTPTECRMQLFVSLADVNDLIHLKTTMLVTCMRSFVLKDGDFEVMWVADIKNVLPSKLDVKTCLCLNQEVAMELAQKLRGVKAVLYVTRAASILLRHHGTGFLDTLAVTAGVDRSELIVLPHNLNPTESNTVPFCGLPDE